MPSGLGGSPVVEEVAELMRRDVHVSLVTLSPDVPSPVVHESEKLTILVGNYRSSPRDRATDLFAAERTAVAELVAASNAEVAHAHWTYEFALGSLAAGVPTLVTAHDAPLNVLRLDRSAYRWSRTALALTTARRAEHMTAVSPYVADHWRRWLRPRRPLAVIPNPVAAEVGSGDRRRADRSTRALTVGYIANGFSRRKNTARLLEAFTRHRAAHPGSTLVLVGAEHGPGEAAHLFAERHGLDEAVDFAGSRPRQRVLEMLRNRIDVLAHVALEECCCMTIAEANRLGVAVVGGRRSGGVPWQLSEGAGLLVDVRSADAIAGALDRLATDPGLLNELVEAGTSRAGRYDSAVVVDAYLDALERVR